MSQDILGKVESNVDEDNILRSALDILHKRIDKVGSVQDSGSIKDYLRISFGGKFEHERFGIVALDPAYRLIGAQVLAEGTLTSTVVAPREVMKAALAVNAAYVILFHTHPAQDPTPSQNDVAMTKRLTEALYPAEVVVLDHMVIAGDQVVSMLEAGLLANRNASDTHSKRLARLMDVLPMLGGR